MLPKAVRAISHANQQPICARCLRPTPFMVPRPTIPRYSTSLFSSSCARRSEPVPKQTIASAPRQINARSTPRKSTPPHKPPKRRLEAASQPLRNAPSSTRGPVLQCIAHTTAERYDLASLAVVLRKLGVRWEEVPEGDRERALVIGPWKGRGGAERLVRGKDIRPTTAIVDEGEDGEEEAYGGFHYGERGEIWVFHSGSFVTWGLSEEEGRAFLRDVIRSKSANVELDKLGVGEYEVEEMDFVVDPTAKTHILGNLILLGAPPELATFHPSSPGLASLLARYTLSLSLSRSSSLSVLEERLDRHIASVAVLPRVLEKSGQQPLGRKEVIRKIGQLMTLRMAVNTSGGGLEETPEFYWSEPELETYFDSIATEFEIKERIETFNRKIDYAQEIHSTLRALLTEASAHRMELIIIALIAVEVVIVLIREGPELGHKLAAPFINYARLILGLPSEAELRSSLDESLTHDAESNVTAVLSPHDDTTLGYLESARLDSQRLV